MTADKENFTRHYLEVHGVNEIMNRVTERERNIERESCFVNEQNVHHQRKASATFSLCAPVSMPALCKQETKSSPALETDELRRC